MFYRLAQLFFKIYFFVFHRLSIRGLDGLNAYLASRPAGSPVILAANHASYLDPPAVGMAFTRPLRFVAWGGLFKVPLFAALIRALGAVPVNPENKNSAAGLLRQVIGFIEDGYSVLIFPEGLRTLDGKLQPLEGGVALISLKTAAPIVPVWLQGTWEAYPHNRKLPRPRKITLTFGDPIDPARLPEAMPEKEKRALLLDDLRLALEAMRDSAAVK